MKLYKTDILRIGHTRYCGHNDEACFICEGDSSQIEYILLREILDLWGHKILGEGEDYYDRNNIMPTGITYSTTLPYEEYKEISDTKDRERGMKIIYSITHLDPKNAELTILKTNFPTYTEAQKTLNKMMDDGYKNLRIAQKRQSNAKN
jgi:hypothetical protein